MERKKVNSRDPGLDILRALAMFLVICLHILGQGGLVANAPAGSGKYYVLSFLQMLCYCAVNVYGITTGYLLWKKPFRLSRIVKIWMTTVFWSVAVSCVFFVLVPEKRTFSEAVSMFLPILRGRYWFFTAYFVVMLVSPVLNLLIQTLSRRQFHLLFVSLFLIFGIIPVGSLGYDVLRISAGHHFSWMVVLYLIGGYLGKNDRRGGTSVSPIQKHPLLCYFGLGLVHLLYKFLTEAVGLAGFGGLLLTYPSPLILGEALCLFAYCKEAFREVSGFGGKLLRFVSPGVYAVYVIHVHPLVYWNQNLMDLCRVWDDKYTLVTAGGLLLAALGVFAVCVTLDALRQRLFRVCGIDRFAETLSDRAEAFVRSHMK